MLCSSNIFFAFFGMQLSNNYDSEYLSTASSVLLLFTQGFGIIIHGKINMFCHDPYQNSILKGGTSSSSGNLLLWFSVWVLEFIRLQIEHY
jgi:hypothetical protein